MVSNTQFSIVIRPRPGKKKTIKSFFRNFINNKEPVIQTQDPIYQPLEPVIQINELVFHTLEPVIQINEPVFHTLEPAIQTENVVAIKRGRGRPKILHCSPSIKRKASENLNSEEKRRPGRPKKVASALNSN